MEYSVKNYELEGIWKETAVVYRDATSEFARRL
jgi:hypothetical protein